jgi:hypothetical protein
VLALQGNQLEGVMERTPRRPPEDANPLRLAGVTVKAVDQIGLAVREEVAETADGIVRGANEVADNLRMLAITIREHSKIAGEHVADFCNRATAVLDGVRDVEAKLRAGLHETQRNETELKASLAIEQPLPDEIGTVPPDEFQLKVAPRPTSQRRD